MADDNNPWQRKPQGPPDLLKLLKNFFSQKSPGGGDGEFKFAALWIFSLVGLVIVLWFLSGIFIVKQAQQAVVLRFGRYVSTAGPGPHWIPSLIESEQKVDVQQIRNFMYQSDMLTKDENIVNVSLAVQFRIANARDFLFNVDNPGATLQQATASALRQVVGQTSLDAILTTGRALVQQQVSNQLKKTIQAYSMGLDVTDVRLLPAKPPEAVTAAFDDAIKAREDRVSYVNKGEAYARKVTSEVKGNIAKLVQSAQAYKQEVVLKAQGDVARYKALLKPYLAAPTVTRERLYLDTVQDVLSHTNNIVVDSGGHNVLYLPLNQMIKSHMGSTDLNSVKLPNPQSAAVNQQQLDQKKSQIENIIKHESYGQPRTNYSANQTVSGGYHS